MKSKCIWISVFLLLGLLVFKFKWAPHTGVCRDFSEMPLLGSYMPRVNLISPVTFYCDPLNKRAAAYSMGRLRDFNSLVDDDYEVIRYESGFQSSGLKLIDGYVPSGDRVYVARRRLGADGRRHIFVFYRPINEDGQLGMIYVQLP